jgi:site-specific recombinase XerD
MTQLTQQWAAHMKFSGAAATTVVTRVRALRRLEREFGPLQGITRADLTTFLSRYEHASSRSTNLSYVRCFYAWALDEGHVEADPTAKLPTVKVPSGDPRPAPVAEVRAMLAAAPPRTRMFALLMAFCGLRCCEVSGVRHAHLNRAADGAWWLDIPHSKGGHQQTVPVPEWVAAEVLAAPEWAVSTQTVQRDVRQAFRAVGSTATPHQLRHYFGTTALNATGDLRKVQKLMRHASPATTARYTAVAASELSAVAEALPRIA